MIKKIFLVLTLAAVSLFAINFQTASKEELMSIKGIGEKRATAIMKYRKTHKIKSAADLRNVPGIGNEIAKNAKEGIKNADKKVKSTRERVKKKKTVTKPKATKRVKKVAGDRTKRANEKAKSEAKKSLRNIKEKAKKH